MFDSNGTNNSYSPVNSDDFNDEDEADEYIRNQQVRIG